jgi:hypothetical protein
MCQQEGAYNLEEEFSDSNSNGGPSCDHPQPPQTTTGSIACVCGNNTQEGTEQCDGTDDEQCVGDETCNDSCRCSPPEGEVACGEQTVDLVIMIDRTGSVSDPDLQAEGQAVYDLLQSFIDNGITGVNVAIGRFPGEEDGTPANALFLGSDPECNDGPSCLTNDYAALQTLVNNHFIDDNHADYEGTQGSTNLQSANSMALTAFNSGSGIHKVYLLFSDGDPNLPVLATADHDARVSANALKDAGVHNIMIAYDASGNDADSISNGGDGGPANPAGDVINRLLMADMASTTIDLVGGRDGCGGDACSGAEETAENGDMDDLYIAAGGAGLEPIFAAITGILDCPDLDNDPCTPENCNENTDICEIGDPIEGCVKCETDDDCNTPDLCDAQRICVKEDGETVGTCADDPQHEPTDCSNDPDLCDGTLACNPQNGECENGPPPPPCDDGEVCTNEVCNPATGACDTTHNTDSCTDGNACTEPDLCGGGSCQSGGAKDCNDNNACTNNDCNTVTGCVNSPITCDDGLACTDDGCDPGSGCTTTPKQCPDDENVCTDPTCTEPNGCGFQNNNHSESCYTGPEGTKDVGICHGGTKTCSGGSFGQCEGEQTPEDEICDGLDNDCDGETDEGNPGGGASCGEEEGECSPGTITCVGGELICVGGTGPSPELCDDKDNDCDGETDEDFDEGESCTVGIGECQNDGIKVCTQDGQGTECDATPGEGSTEICDGKDNDCDEQTDEGGDSLCDDGLACNGQEVCEGEGGCQAGETVICDDDRACSDDECTEPNGQCVFNTDDCVCDSDADCEDSNPCTANTCDVNSGSCSTEPLTNDQCDNGVPREPPDDTGGGQEIPGDIRCLTGSGSPGGFNNGTCAGCSLGATGTTPLGAALGLGILMFLPWVLRKSLVRARR